MIKTKQRLHGRNKPLFRTCKQSQPVQLHTKTMLSVNVKIQSDIASVVAVVVACLMKRTNSHTRDLILNGSTRARNFDYAANAQIIMIKIDYSTGNLSSKLQHSKI